MVIDRSEISDSIEIYRCCTAFKQLLDKRWRIFCSVKMDVSYARVVIPDFQLLSFCIDGKAADISGTDISLTNRFDSIGFSSDLK